MPESNQRGALTEAVYYILLSLMQPLHGYGIMQYVSELSKDRVQLGPGTLYGALNTLVKKDWIRIYDTKAKGRKKEYIITDTGREILQDEINRLQELLLAGQHIMEVNHHE